MSSPRWHTDFALVLVGVLVCLGTLLPGLGRYGLWEPWEVATLEASTAAEAHGAEEGDAERRRGGGADRITAWITTGVLEGGGSEASARLPVALAGLASLMAALLLGAAIFGWRPAIFGCLVLAGLPLFLVTTRLLVASPFPVLAFTLVTGGAALACFGPFRPATNAVVGLSVLIVGLVLGEGCAGFFMGRVVPMFGAVVGLSFARPWQQGRVALGVWGLLLTSFAVMTIADVAMQDLSVFARPPGGSGDFTEVIRRLFHGSVPWVGLLVVGLGVLFHPAGLSDRQARAATVLATSVVVSLIAQTIWSNAWRHVPYMALWPLCMGAGLLLHVAMTDGQPRRVAALVCGLVMLLGLRDLWLEPSVILAPLLDSSAQFPEGVGGKLFFGSVMAGLGLPLVLTLVSGGEKAERSGVLQWVKSHLGRTLEWRGRAAGVRWVVIGIPILLLVHAVAVAFSPPAFWFPLLSCIERRIWVAAGAVVPVGLLVAVGGKLVWDLLGRVGRAKVPFVMAIGVGFTLVSVHVVLPSFSRHFSSRGVVLTYERLRDGDEPLLAYRASTRAVELLGTTEVEQVTDPEQLVQRLTGPGKVFALIRSEDLAKIDVRYRTARSEHLPVVDNSSATTLLLSNRLGAGQENVNPLVRIVPRERPRPSYLVNANFDDRIDLLGTDIVGPGGSETVCPMSSFTLTFYWHCRRSVSGNQKIFVHIDGYGQRINGDHYPADGQYLVRHWREGDYIVDEQRLEVPTHFRPGDYTVYVGFFVGSTRLPVKGGPAGNDNRVRAGLLKVR